MVEKIQSESDFRAFLQEREQVSRLRNAMSFCKNLLEISATADESLSAEERLNFEKCLTENFLVKYGHNYFGKRDLIYLDLYGTQDAQRLTSN